MVKAVRVTCQNKSGFDSEAKKYDMGSKNYYFEDTIISACSYLVRTPSLHRRTSCPSPYTPHHTPLCRTTHVANSFGRTPEAIPPRRTVHTNCTPPDPSHVWSSHLARAGTVRTVHTAVTLAAASPARVQGYRTAQRLGHRGRARDPDVGAETLPGTRNRGPDAGGGCFAARNWGCATASQGRLGRRLTRTYELCAGQRMTSAYDLSVWCQRPVGHRCCVTRCIAH